MYYVYVLYNLDKSPSRNFYIGLTNNLSKRIKEHNAGESSWTKKFGPWKLIYYESYLSAKDARKREPRLKHHGKGWHELKLRLIASIYEAKKVWD